MNSCVLPFDVVADDSLITGPLSLKSYTTVADFMDKKTKFSFKEGTTVQVIQKDPGGKYGASMDQMQWNFL